MAMVTITFNGQKIGEFPLDKPAVIVGRDPACDLQIDNLGISRTHCQFIKRGGTFLIQDMNSANGTYVNGQQIGEHYLKDGDEVLIGKFALVFNTAGTVARPAQAVGSGGEAVPDVLHTYVMDGENIRERLARMKAEGGPAEETPIARRATARITPQDAAAPAEPGGPPAAGQAAKPPQRPTTDIVPAFDPLKPQSVVPVTKARGAVTRTFASRPEGGGLLYLSMALNAILVVLIVFLLVLMLRLMQRLEPGPGAPAVQGVPLMRGPAPAADAAAGDETDAPVPVDASESGAEEGP